MAKVLTFDLALAAARRMVDCVGAQGAVYGRRVVHVAQVLRLLLHGSG